MDHILSIILVTPLAGMVVLLLLPSSNERLIKVWANIAGLAGFLVTLPLIVSFQSGGGMQFTERASWIPSIGASYSLGVDGYALLLVVLTALLGFVSILCSWNYIQHRLKEYYAYFLILQFSMLGVFMALDFLLFFLFWELVLVPMYFIIAIWGGPRRVYAAIKFLIYTVIGSVVMFLGILTLYFQHASQSGNYSFAVAQLLNTQVPGNMQWWVFWAFFLGFAVKVPMWPFHTWLPDAHVEAPTAGSVILAGVLLKMGTFGFLRYSFPLLPDAAKDAKVIQLFAVLSIIAIIYGALVSLMQKDWKKLVAYSSVSHMGFCTLGMIAMNQAGITGSMLQQINHGVSTSLLFLIAGIIYERRHTREISEFGGLLRVMPVFTIVFLITALSSMGMPPLNGFIGEIIILQGAYQASIAWAVACVIGIALGAAYLIWLFQRTMFGDLSPKNEALADLSAREIVVVAPLIILVFWIGLYPTPFLNILQPSANEIVQRVNPQVNAATRVAMPGVR
jgi:NADH-quinone oxidoreductase subunit M